MNLESFVAAFSALALLIVAAMLRRFEKRLDHIDELRVADATHTASVIALKDRVTEVEHDADRWAAVVPTLATLAQSLQAIVAELLRRERP